MFESDNAEEALDLGEGTGETGGGDESGEGKVVDPTPVVEEDPSYEVKVGGKTFKVPLSELRNGYQRQSDYSKKTMELSDMRKNMEAEKMAIMKQVSELRQWISNPENLKSYYQQLTQSVIDNADSDEPLTPAKVQQLVAAQLRQQEQTLTAKQQAALMEIENKRQADQINAELGVVIKGLISSHPELGSVDGIEALLYRDVAAQRPEDVEEAKRLFTEAAARRAEKIRSAFTEQRKKEVVREEKNKNGIQPPGGSPVVDTKQKKFKLGSQDLVNQVVNDLMAKGE